MKHKDDIIKIADTKLAAAKHLLRAGFCEDSYYIGGYTIELLLKARICATLGIENFYEESFLSKLKSPQSFKSHNINQLIILAGLYKEYNISCLNPTNVLNWSQVVKWNEGHRYMVDKDRVEVRNFLTSVEQIAKWIKSYL